MFIETQHTKNILPPFHTNNKNKGIHTTLHKSTKLCPPIGGSFFTIIQKIAQEIGTVKIHPGGTEPPVKEEQGTKEHTPHFYIYIYTTFLSRLQLLGTTGSVREGKIISNF